MSDTSLPMVLLYALGDLVFALLAGIVLALPLAVPVAVWYLRR